MDVPVLPAPGSIKVTADIFEIGDTVSVSGVSKGKGFAGHMKKHNFYMNSILQSPCIEY